MKIKMELLSDTIFGNGMSIPGAEDTSVLHDEYGFPYYKGSTFKGVLREQYARYLEWEGCSEKQIHDEISQLFGESGVDIDNGKLTFSDFVLSPFVRKTVYDEIGDDADKILSVLSNVRSFTSINEKGVAKQGSLRMARCVNKGLIFYSEILNDKEIESLDEIVCSIKWIGSMRNRGFGKVKFTVLEDES